MILKLVRVSAVNYYHKALHLDVAASLDPPMLMILWNFMVILHKTFFACDSADLFSI